MVPNASNEAVRISGGCPYFLKELGYVTRAVAQGDTVELVIVQDAVDAYKAKFDGSFFRMRLDRARSHSRGSNRSAICTLAERSTRYVMLLHLLVDDTAEAVRDGADQDGAHVAGAPAPIIDLG